LEKNIIMYEDDIDEILSYNYWPVVDIDWIPNKSYPAVFVAKIYKNKTRGKLKGWKLLKTRSFKTPIEAWEYLREILNSTLKFVL
jgi:hypothetical protein